VSDAKCLRGTSSPVSHRLGKAVAEKSQKGEWAAAKEEEEEKEEEQEEEQEDEERIACMSYIWLGCLDTIRVVRREHSASGNQASCLCFMLWTEGVPAQYGNMMRGRRGRMRRESSM
jgi:hypothetical protein